MLGDPEGPGWRSGLTLMSGDHVLGESRTDVGVTLPRDQESGTEWVRVAVNRWTDTLSLVLKALKKQSERRGENVYME